MNFSIYPQDYDGKGYRFDEDRTALENVKRHHQRKNRLKPSVS